MATARPPIIGASTGPEAPFPLQMEGKVINGYGRGSKELGIPTANLPVDAATALWIADIKDGVYFGWAGLRLPPNPNNSKLTDANSALNNSKPTVTESGFSVYPMVMSIGSNKFYNTTTRTAEAHILHDFGAGVTFYGAEMRLLVLGFIREMNKVYPDVGALIEDIRVDCEVARRSLGREAWAVRESETGEGRGTLDGSWLVREPGEQNGHSARDFQSRAREIRAVW
ncbi:riboflavin kinase [Mycena polygramma]|nr:riboflavin kinase [Mycena polygramma]